MIQVSVVIPTYNRHAILLETLDSISRQVGEAAFEVIVVDDGSQDATPSVASSNYPFPLKYIRQQNQGSAAARNLGADQADGEVLVFLDDDMLLEPGYLAGLADLHQRHSKAVGMGRFLPWLPPQPTLFNIIYARAESTPELPQEGSEVSFAACSTNNLSVERKDFTLIGRMQDVAGDGPTWWGDVDFGYRAYRLGYTIRCSGVAACRHRDYAIRDLATACARSRNVARMAILLLKKHPEIQAHLPMFFDKYPIRFGKDPLVLTLHKMLRRGMSGEPVLSAMQSAAGWLEKVYPNPALLRCLYRWILGGYLYQGFQEGLRLYGAPPAFDVPHFPSKTRNSRMKLSA